jgi:hypothetical protein
MALIKLVIRQSLVTKALSTTVLQYTYTETPIWYTEPSVALPPLWLSLQLVLRIGLEETHLKNPNWGGITERARFALTSRDQTTPRCPLHCNCLSSRGTRATVG